MNNDVFNNVMRIAASKGVTKKMDVAAMIGANSQKLTNWKSRGIPPSLYKQIADSLGVSVDELIGNIDNIRINSVSNMHNTSPAFKSKRKVAVISWVQAGMASEAIDLHEPGMADDWVDASCPVSDHTYALRVVGQSMTPLFNEGMILIIEPDISANSGDFVIAKNSNGEVTFKQYEQDSGKFFLKPLNPQYPIIPIDDYQIIGVLRDAIIKFR